MWHFDLWHRNTTCWHVCKRPARLSPNAGFRNHLQIQGNQWGLRFATQQQVKCMQAGDSAPRRSQGDRKAFVAASQCAPWRLRVCHWPAKFTVSQSCRCSSHSISQSILCQMGCKAIYVLPQQIKIHGSSITYILLASILVPTKYDDFNSREHRLGGGGGREYD
jgi:hypothetical protein